MFIHWGLYSQAGGRWKGKTYYGIAEWIMHLARVPAKEYETLAPRFNPVDFNAIEWVRLAKAAGMKYIVITAKHHEGFAMFRSKVSRFNIVDATPFKRDPLKELAKACRKEGLKLGFYYSQYQDWHEPDAAGNSWDFKQKGDFNKYLHEKAIPQIKELLTNYGPVALIWFDTPGNISREAAQELLDMVRKLQPGCLVNGRLGHGLGDYISLGDQEVPLTAPKRLWETIDTHNDTWAYAWCDHRWKSARELVSRLVRVVGLGGNYALNVGPTGRGVIPAESASILRQVGQWVSRNSESIYGSEPSPLGRQAWGCSTLKSGKLYLHVLNWPSDGELWVPGLKANVKGAYLLTTRRNLKFSRKGGILRIQIPKLAPDSIATVIVLDVAGAIKARGRGKYVYNGLVNEMDAPFAKLVNCRHGKRSWMEKFGDWHHVDVVENWSNGSSARWDVTALKPGMFSLCADYECQPDAEGSELEMSLGETRWSFPVLCTGGGACGRVRIRHETLGTIAIPKAGKYTLSIRGLDVKGESAFLLQKLTLEPV